MSISLPLHGWLDRPWPAAVMGDTSVAAGGQKKHLISKASAVSGQHVTEHDGLSNAPIFVVDFDVPRIFFADSHVWHDRFPFYMGCARLPQWSPPVMNSVSPVIHDESDEARKTAAGATSDGRPTRPRRPPP